MSSSLREIDITVPERRFLPVARCHGVLSRAAGVPEVREGTDKPVLRTTESPASGKGVVLPRLKYAIDVYQQNMEARRTAAGPLFVDTYA